MKCFKVLIICLTLISCSLDNKTGIWKNEKNDIDDESNIFKEFNPIVPVDPKIDNLFFILIN